jgi:hypothetical protein
MYNLDKLIMILKNWPSDATTSYTSKNLKVEDKMLDNFEKELKDASTLMA